MPDYGLTDEGFHRKRYADIISDVNDRARDLFGENVNLTAASPLGIFLRIIAWSISKAWQVAEVVYNAGFVDTAEGQSLDHVGKYIGITRRPAERATGIITITGDANTTVPDGFLVATEEDVEFKTTDEVDIPAGGEVDADVRAVEPGLAGNVEAATITEIITVIEGVDEVTNAAPTDGGRETERDLEFRNRYTDSVARPGASTVDSIWATLLEVENVMNAVVIPDRTAKTIEAVVHKGDSVDICQAILDTKAAGIETIGTVTETVKDSADQEHDMNFNRPTEIDVEVEATVTPGDDYPEDGDNRVQTELIRHIGGTDEDGVDYPGLGMGEDVIHSRLVKACFDVDGVADVTVELAEKGEILGDANITVALQEIALTHHTDVTVIST